jgi:hypothetical protein
VLKSRDEDYNALIAMLRDGTFSGSISPCLPVDSVPKSPPSADRSASGNSASTLPRPAVRHLSVSYFFLMFLNFRVGLRPMQVHNNRAQVFVMTPEIVAR